MNEKPYQAIGNKYGKRFTGNKYGKRFTRKIIKITKEERIVITSI